MVCALIDINESKHLSRNYLSAYVYTTYYTYIIYLYLLGVPYFVYYFLGKAVKDLWLPWAICNRHK